MALITNLKKAHIEFNEKSTSVANLLGGGKLRIYLSMLYCLVRYGARPIDYERFEFYDKSSRRRGQYLTFMRYIALFKRLKKETASYANISADKIQEYKTFSKYIHRPWMTVDPHSCNMKELADFVAKHQRVIAKPSCGEQGHGVTILTPETDLKSFIKSIDKTEYMVEGLVRNCRKLHDLNPTSLNTLRVVTLIDKAGEVHVLGAWLRVGVRGKVVDNWGAGGIGYNVDINTGIIDRLGRDKKNNLHLFHPGTDKCMVGFCIPEFEEVIRQVKEMAMVTPYARYVGWDIAITDNGIDLIEMNLPPGHDMMQSFDTPVYDKIRQLI